MRSTKKLRAGIATLAITGAALMSTATVASANEQGTTATCAYPYVCFIKNGSIIGQFQDVTSTWQALPSKPTAPLTVVNTRHDDVAYIRWVGGGTTCIPPQQSFGVTGGQLDAVRISSAATC
ncbi:hypothetical protein ACFVT1_35695 [Streptomyces sp. NPDC057963]|uniref:hypothetical protein n=1 Tax=Streptomyces sp. NPDC057963 TaxID=3346290 RepID=UPI0036E7A114